MGRSWPASVTCEATEMVRRGPFQSLRWLWFISSPGKFQMQVLPQCGHAVHEDAPDKVSVVLDACKRATVRVTVDLTEDSMSP